MSGALMRLGHRNALREDHVTTQRKGGHLKPRRRNQPCLHLDLGLLASRIVKNQIPAVSACTSSWHFVTVALANYIIMLSNMAATNHTVTAPEMWLSVTEELGS